MYALHDPTVAERPAATRRADVASQGERAQLRARRAVAFVELNAPGRAGLSHLPGLDGLRGLAVAAVVAFHAGFDRMVGGYLGVSTFFTLSGFLITSLLLSRARPGADLVRRGFWGRRMRRLYPAAVVTLGLVVVLFAPFVATPDQLATMGPDVFASLGQVANWWFIVSGQTYAELFVAPSPVLHFWSLAIEEQFYLFFPLLLAGLWRVTRGRAPRLGAALGALTVVLVLWGALGGLSDQRIYFGTDTRAPELLLGALLALGLARRPVRLRLASRRPWRVGAIALGAVALTVQMWWWWGLPQSTPWLYRGGFAGYAVASCAVVVAAALPWGPVHRLCTTAALRWLGVRSYAVYLAHWPLMLAFRQLWPGVDRLATTLAAVAVTLVLAELSLRYLERPVRTSRWPSPRAAPMWALGSAGLVVALVFALVPTDPPGRAPDLAAGAQDFARFLDREADAPAGTDSPDGAHPADAPAPQPPPTVAVFGDSTALGVGMGLGEWSVATGRLGVAPGDLRFGCGVARVAELHSDDRRVPDAECLAWPTRWAEVVSSTKPDVVLLMSAIWSVADVRLPGSDSFSAVGDPAVDRFLVDELTHAVDVLAAEGALVVLVTWPVYGEWADDGRSEAFVRQADPARMQRYNELLAEVAAQRPGQVEVLDLAGWLGSRAQDRTLRADGTHFADVEFRALSEEWFGGELERLWQARLDPGATDAGATDAGATDAGADRADAGSAGG